MSKREAVCGIVQNVPRTYFVEIRGKGSAGFCTTIADDDTDSLGMEGEGYSLPDARCSSCGRMNYCVQSIDA